MALDNVAGTGMSSILSRQKAAHIRDGIPSAAKRIEWIDKSIDLLVTHGDALAEAIQRWIDEPAAMGALGDRGRARVAARHTLDHTLDAVRSVWADLGVLL